LDAATFYQRLFEPLEFLGPGTHGDTMALLQRLRLGAGKRLLELGAGTGLSAVLAAQTGCEVVATDLSAAFLAAIERRVQAASVADRVTVKKVDLRKPGNLGRFDAVLCEGAAYVIGLGNALRAWRGLLVPGGRLALSHLVLADTADPRGEEVRAFWRRAMKEPLLSLLDTARIMEDEGYQVEAAWQLGPDAWQTYLEPVRARLAEVAPEIPAGSAAQESLQETRTEVRMQLDRGGTRYVTYAAFVLGTRV